MNNPDTYQAGYEAGYDDAGHDGLCTLLAGFAIGLILGWLGARWLLIL